MPLFWLSFCDASRPKGSQFIGACIVRSGELTGAVPEAWFRRCNPGGEVMIIEIPKEKEECALSQGLNRLFTIEEIEQQMGGAVKTKDLWPED